MLPASPCCWGSGGSLRGLQRGGREDRLPRVALPEEGQGCRRRCEASEPRQAAAFVHESPACKLLPSSKSLSLKTRSTALAGGSVGWSIVPQTKRLQVQSPVGLCTGGNQSMFLFLSLSHPPPASKINKNAWDGGWGRGSCFIRKHFRPSSFLADQGEERHLHSRKLLGLRALPGQDVSSLSGSLSPRSTARGDAKRSSRWEGLEGAAAP